MPRFSWRGSNVPPEHHAFETSLPDVKNRAWAAVVGERRPAVLPSAPPRRMHPGLLDDLPFPEGPIRRRAAVLPAAVRAALRALGIGGGMPAIAPAAAGGTVPNRRAAQRREPSATGPDLAGPAGGRKIQRAA